MKNIIVGIVAVLLMVFFGPSAWATGPATTPLAHYTKEQIEIRLYQSQVGLAAQLPFTTILLDRQHNIPYVSIETIFSNLFGYKTHCTISNASCLITSVPPDYQIAVDGNSGLVTVTYRSAQTGKATTAHFQFTTAELLNQQGELWLRYDLLEKLLPIQSRWDGKSYRITLTTALPLYELIKKNRAAETQRIQARQQTAQLQSSEKKSNTIQITPTHPFDAGIKYQLQRQQSIVGEDNYSQTNLNYTISGDLFTGTLLANSGYDLNHYYPQEPTWSYTFVNKPDFHLLQFGNTYSDSSPFMGQVNLQNGVKFNLTEEANTSLEFYYQGQAMPGTDVNVWRGDYLFATLTVDASGRFEVFDPDPEPGDIYRLQYYYPDGTESTQLVRYASDRNLLLGKNTWDLDTSYGQLFTTTTGSGTLAENLVRYGLTKQITLGLGSYWVKLAPANEGSSATKPQDFHYGDIVYQPLPYLNLQYSKMLDEEGYAARSVFTYFDRHFITVDYRRMDPNNELLELPTVTGYFNDTHYFEVKDRYELTSRWRVVSDYQDFDQGRLLESGLTGRWTNLYGLGLWLGEYEQSTEGYFNIRQQSTFYFNRRNLMQFQVNWNKVQGDAETLNYTYRDSTNNYSGSLAAIYSSLSHSLQCTTSLYWIASRYIQLGATLSQNSIMLNLAFSDTAGLYTHYNDPNQFGMATISGTVMTPPDDNSSSKPLAGITVRAGGTTAVTDEQGRYLLSPVLTLQSVPFTLEQESLGLEYTALYPHVSAVMRPNTHAIYDPILTYAIGIDGYILSSKNLPATVGIVAIPDEGTGRVYYGTVIPDDGFYTIENLAPGRYTLKVTGVDTTLKTMKVIVLKPQESWVGGINLNLDK